MNLSLFSDFDNLLKDASTTIHTSNATQWPLLLCNIVINDEDNVTDLQDTNDFTPFFPFLLARHIFSVPTLPET